MTTDQLLRDLTGANPAPLEEISPADNEMLIAAIDASVADARWRTDHRDSYAPRGSWTRGRRRIAAAAVSFAAVVAMIAVVALQRPTDFQSTSPTSEAPTSPTTTTAGNETVAPATTVPNPPAPTTTVAPAIVPQGSTEAEARSAPTGGTPLPNIGNAVAGDDGAGPLPLGTINQLPNEHRLDFLFEFCFGPCYRDAHFMDPDNPDFGSGPWTAGKPFHVRHGFPAQGSEPLGPGFDVVLYVTPMDLPGEWEGRFIDDTVRYTSDYVLRGESDACGPNYKSQTGPITCEWFLHDFPDGLPEGRFGLWAFWEAPCWAWVEYGLLGSCVDPNEVMSHFQSGFDSPFGDYPPSYTEVDNAHLTPKEIEAMYGFAVEDHDLGPPIDASGAVANFSTSPPDFASAVAGDDGSGPLPLGTINTLPGEDYLDFLFEFCSPSCYRDAHFMDPENPDFGSGPWTAGRPFHVRHGFPAQGSEPLGPGFDVVLYITPADEAPGEFGGEPIGAPVRYTSDYVLRGESDACGPNYKTQSGTITCEWFVHDFPNGLPAGRYDLWAFWYAPCQEWIDYGFTAACTDPNEVLSLFSSGVNSPFGDYPPSFDERDEA